MDEDKIFADPCNEMVFECAFDDLMKEVRCEEFVYVSSWKVAVFLERSPIVCRRATGESFINRLTCD